MANQNSNATISELVRQHGETLARITTIVEQDHEDLEALKKSTEIIAKAVARQEGQDAFWTRFWNFAIPITAALVGALAGHFIR